METKTIEDFITCGVYIRNIINITISRSLFKGKALVLKQKIYETEICMYVLRENV